MAHPVGGPLRTLATALRGELSTPKEEAFQLARRVLRALADGGFVVRRSARSEADADAEALDELASWLATAPVPVAPPPPPAQPVVIVAPEAPAAPAPISAPSAPPPGGAFALSDELINVWIDRALDAHDALLGHRPDVARKQLERLLELLSQALQP